MRVAKFPAIAVGRKRKMANEKRLIDANALRLDIIFAKSVLATDEAGEWTKGYRAGLDSMFSTIEEQPTVDAVGVVHGRWERVDESLFRCSACSEWILMQNDWYYYCPNCGAKMDGDGNA